MQNDYRKRIADDILQFRLKTAGAVLIEGAKWCGKTRTATENSNSQLYMQDPDKQMSYSQAADAQPSLLLKGDTPRLLDEWQTAPVLWDAVRFEVDRSGDLGKFILTGSAVPKDNSVMHTGTGRISRMTMRPMTLFESGDSSGNVSLSSLFDGSADLAETSDLSIENIASLIVRGGWPASVGKPEEVAQRLALDYVEAVINRDVSQVDGVQKNPARVRALMKSLARNISTTATIKTIFDDIHENDTGDELSEKSIRQYLYALERIFVIENIPAWKPSLRSKSAIRTSVKRQFVDPSIAAAVLRLTPAKLLQDFNYFGFLFEALCARDLRVYAESIDGQLFHYRDSSGLESDSIIALNDGRWAAVEVKLGSSQIDEAAKHLIKISQKVDTTKIGEPSFLMVLTGGELAYRRKDGVCAVPLGCLKN